MTSEIVVLQKLKIISSVILHRFNSFQLNYKTYKVFDEIHFFFLSFYLTNLVYIYNVIGFVFKIQYTYFK